jgi:hypothetical protein
MTQSESSLSTLTNSFKSRLSSALNEQFEMSVDSKSIVNSERFFPMSDIEKFRNNRSRYSFSKTLLSKNCDRPFDIFSTEKRSSRESMAAISIPLQFTKNFRAHESTERGSRIAGKSAVYDK